jgi:DNA-binding NarL/FixJ family response regulator
MSVEQRKRSIENDIKLVEQFKTYSKFISILYVEDEQKIREATTESVLKKSFGEVSVAQDGVEALELYKKNPADIVLTDINMPQMNGIELAKAIREINPNQPIIVLSAHNESGYYIDLIQLGVDAFLLKPVEILNFMYTMSRVCKTIYDSRERERLQNELVQQQNRSIALCHAVQTGRSIDSSERQLLAQKYNKISAKKFCDEYPTDIEIINDKLAAIDEKLDILTIQLGSSSDAGIKTILSDSLARYANIIAAIYEFSNLSAAIARFAQFLLTIDTANKPSQTLDLLLGVAENVMTWRITVLEERSAEDIHYMDASIISDCLQVEASFSDVLVDEDETVFF